MRAILKPWLLIIIVILNSDCTQSRSRSIALKDLIQFSNIENEDHAIEPRARIYFSTSSKAQQNSNANDRGFTGDRVSVSIDSTSSQFACSSKFLNVDIGSGIIQGEFKRLNFGSKRLQVLAHALSPCTVRVGGTKADFLTFVPDQNEESHDGQTEPSKDENLLLDHPADQSFQKKSLTKFTMSESFWKTFLNFLRVVEWDMTFDFNLFRRHEGLWDPSNAQLLLNYTDALGYDIAAFQLGNEPNGFYHHFNFSIEPPELVRDLAILRKILSQYPRYSNSQIFGPDVTGLTNHPSARKYLQGFVQAGGGDLVSEISLHHYYLNGRTATVGDFVDIDVLDEFKKEIQTALEITGSQAQPLSILFTETGSCFGGGAPGLSDAYVAGFLWLDKLGLSAQYGVTKVFRQSFVGGHYGLLSSDYLPYPDYFLSLLHKRLILGPVFNVTTSPVNKDLRVYAHCARTDFYNYPEGSLTLSYLNLGTVDLTLTLSQFQGQTLLLYSLTPGDDKGLQSRFVKLNGHKLEMVGDQLPPLTPSEHTGDITLPALTFGFIVVPGAGIVSCTNRQTSP